LSSFWTGFLLISFVHTSQFCIPSTLHLTIFSPFLVRLHVDLWFTRSFWFGTLSFSHVWLLCTPRSARSFTPPLSALSAFHLVLCTHHLRLQFYFFFSFLFWITLFGWVRFRAGSCMDSRSLLSWVHSRFIFGILSFIFSPRLGYLISFSPLDRLPLQFCVPFALLFSPLCLSPHYWSSLSSLPRFASWIFHLFLHVSLSLSHVRFALSRSHSPVWFSFSFHFHSRSLARSPFYSLISRLHGFIWVYSGSPLICTLGSFSFAFAFSFWFSRGFLLHLHSQVWFLGLLPLGSGSLFQVTGSVWFTTRFLFGLVTTTLPLSFAISLAPRLQVLIFCAHFWVLGFQVLSLFTLFSLSFYSLQDHRSLFFFFLSLIAWILTRSLSWFFWSRFLLCVIVLCFLISLSLHSLSFSHHLFLGWDVLTFSG